MSIWPVRLAKWFPRKPSRKIRMPLAEQREMNQNMKMVVQFSSCYYCGNEKMKWKYEWGHHSIPWGNGDVWCNKECYDKWRKE